MKTRLRTLRHYSVLWLVLATACTNATPPDSTQRGGARGARDPIQASVIVGSEGKGMFTGAGVAQQTTTLTAMDYIEIQQLVNRLNFALDYCTSGGRAFADLFVEGGQFIIDQGDGKTTVRRTRSELIALAGGPDCTSRRSPPSSYILHLAESLVIEPAADGARGTSYAIYPPSKGRYYNADTAGQLGIYHDEYVKTREGWRFRSRRHELNPSPAG